MLNRFLAILVAINSLPAWAGLSALVDTRVGTAPAPTATLGADGEKIGNTQPSATLPFGMVQWGPDTRLGSSTNYLYTDKQIVGFSLTHLSGAGCTNSGELSFLPFTDSATPAAFSHDQETATAGAYSIKLASGIQVDLSATTRTGFARFRFPEGSTPKLAINFTRSNTGKLGGAIDQHDSQHLTGWVQGGNFCGAKNKYRVYFTISFDQAAQSVATDNGVATLSFTNPNVLAKVGLSYVSETGAALNLQTENAGWDFEAVRAQAQNTWERALSLIKVSPPTSGARQMSGETQTLSGTQASAATFYTALYHSLLHPNVASDTDGNYLGFDQKPHALASGQSAQYANFSGWDVYRSQIPLVALLDPARAGDIAQSLVNDGQQCGALPKWAQNNDDTGIMVGDPGAAIVADISAFGATHFDRASALELMSKSGLQPGTKCNNQEVRPGLKQYLKLGYVSYDYKLFDFYNQSASMSLEYNSADFAISRFADSLGENSVRDQFRAHADGWKKLFDPATQLIHPRYGDGSWTDSFNATTTAGFTEGNATQYTWMIPFDLPELFGLIGGEEKSAARLDAYFTQLNAYKTQPNLWIGNEPSFSSPWFSHWLGKPEDSWNVVTRIVNTQFSTTPGGIPGNDDLGATSSWYVWASLGLYPAVPGTSDLMLVPPQFARVELTPEGGKTLVLTRSGSGPAIAGVSREQGAWTRNWIGASDVRGGGELDFTLGASPSGWGHAAADLPPTY